MFVVDNESHAIVQVNKAAISKYERAPEEFLSLTFPVLFQAEDQDRIKDFIQSVELLQNKNNQGRFRMVNPSGALVDTDLYATQVDFNGRNCSSFVAVDVTEKIQFENTVTSAIIKTQEDERYEIGGELHDNVCQLLASGQMSLARLKKIVPEEYLSSFDQTRSYIQQASIEIRNLSHRLAPAFFDDNTLEDTFQTPAPHVQHQRAIRDHFLFRQKSTQENRPTTRHPTQPLPHSAGTIEQYFKIRTGHQN